MPDEAKKVFVYGTLKVGGRFALALDKVRESSHPAKVVGKLINVNGNFPGLVEGDGTVHGEIHEYRQFKRVLLHMDSIEGYVHSDPDHSLYKRKVVEAETESGGKEEAYAYFFNQSTKGMEEVKTGIWKI